MSKGAIPAKFAPPLRKKSSAAYGTAGRPIRLITNFFPVRVGDQELDLIHYDVSIKNYAGNEKIPKRIKKLIFKEWRKCFPMVLQHGKLELAYDGEKNAYAVQTIDRLQTTFEVRLTENDDGTPRAGAAPAQPVAAALLPVVGAGPDQGGKKKRKGKKKGKAGDDAGKTEEIPVQQRDKNVFSVTFKKVDHLNVRDLMASLKHDPNKRVPIPTVVMNMLEVMFRHYRAEQYNQIGRNSFFNMDERLNQPWDLGGAKEGLVGFFASLRPAAWKDGSILLNFDKSHCAFYKPQTVLDFIQEVGVAPSRSGPRSLDLHNLLSNIQKHTIQKEIKGLKVRVCHSYIKRTYRVNGLTSLGANQLKFTLEEDGKSQTITVDQYFKTKYKVNLKYPHLNCLHVGNPTKNVYVPMELCTIEKGQRVMKKLDRNETTNFIRHTAVNPADRLREIKNMASKCKFLEDPMLKAMKFTISDEPLKITGRVLPEPTLRMQQKTFNPRQGVWDVKYYQFHVAKPLGSWVVFNFDPYVERELFPFLDAIVSHGKRLGMEMYEPKFVKTTKSFNKYHNFFSNAKQQFPDLQLIMCILSQNDDYGILKKTGDVDLKVITQCITGKTVKGRGGRGIDSSTINNILMKINAKLGGINNIFEDIEKLSFAKVLVLGADVNHPPAGGSTSMPSIAAVVGSIDNSATKYAVEVRSQKHRSEIILDMRAMVKNLLMAFRAGTGNPPAKIIMYRDGVSESQFQEVLASEMMSIRDACTSLSEAYKPPITFLCVQKRHHTRLFVENFKDGVGKSGNVPPGTIVDREITHPTEIDFYLCSHQGIQGTSKPAHYHVLWDDSSMQIDQLQRITYELCHVYSRCSRSVSIPTPAYYAHLAAFRAKHYAATKIGDEMSYSSGATGSSDLDEEIVKLTNIGKGSLLSNRLYYV